MHTISKWEWRHLQTKLVLGVSDTGGSNHCSINTISFQIVIQVNCDLSLCLSLVKLFPLLCCLLLNGLLSVHSPDTAELSTLFSFFLLSEMALWAKRPLHVSWGCWPLTQDTIPGCYCECCCTETVTCPEYFWKTLVSLLFSPLVRVNGWGCVHVPCMPSCLSFRRIFKHFH